MNLFAVAMIGLAMYAVAWIFFRKPGESFAYVPIWRAHEFLNPAGTVLAVVGSVGAAIALVMYFMEHGFRALL